MPDLKTETESGRSRIENCTDSGFKALDELGILHLKDRSILSLSGGERKMVFIARAIAQGAETLILDEPTNHLDICHQLFLMNTTDSAKGRF